jgi:polar amino acid transport system permease protein
VLAAVDWHVVWQRIFHPDHVFFRALYTTVYIAVISQVMGVLLGLVAALMRTSRVWPLRFLSGLYVLIFRGTPLLVQIFFIYYGVNLLLGFTLIPNSLNLGLFSLDGAVVAGILALGVNEGAYMREIIRAGIDSIDKGQMEAAKSLGMRYGLAMRRIILPQAARVIVPPLGNEFNNMLKTTSRVFTIGVYEMFAVAEIHYSNSFQPVEYFLAVAFWYLVLTGVWGLIQAALERRLAAAERGDELSFRERLTTAWAPAGAFVRR